MKQKGKQHSNNTKSNLETINENSLKEKNRRTLKLNTDISKLMPRKQSSRFQLPGLGPFNSALSPSADPTSPKFSVEESPAPIQVRRPKPREGVNKPIFSFDMEVIDQVGESVAKEGIKLPEVRDRYSTIRAANSSTNSTKLRKPNY